MKLLLDVTTWEGADPAELAEQVLDYLCGGDTPPGLVKSCNGCDPVEYDFDDQPGGERAL